MEETSKKVIFSAVKPTGALTLGSYAGALRNWIAMQDEYTCYYCVADLHSITVRLTPADFRRNTLDMLAMYLALGIDPEKCTLFLQSHVSAHAELAWILNCNTLFGEARRMTQFKEKSKRDPENVNVGLFDYPVLMAADILLYQADLVPVGQDQKQHVELARNIAQRFNGRYSPTFVLPEPIIPKHGAKIYGLQNPAAKMSKSEENPNDCVYLADDPDTIARKFKTAVTDSETCVRYNRAEKPGISNLLTIYATFANTTPEKAEKEFAGCGYADFKKRVGDAVIAFLSPVQAEYRRIAADKAYMQSVLWSGAEKAAYTARKTLSKVYRNVGFLEKV